MLVLNINKELPIKRVLHRRKLENSLNNTLKKYLLLKDTLWILSMINIENNNSLLIPMMFCEFLQ
jgi:hypothetical protein